MSALTSKRKLAAIGLATVLTSAAVFHATTKTADSAPLPPPCLPGPLCTTPLPGSPSSTVTPRSNLDHCAIDVLCQVTEDEPATQTQIKQTRTTKRKVVPPVALKQDDCESEARQLSLLLGTRARQRRARFLADQAAQYGRTSASDQTKNFANAVWCIQNPLSGKWEVYGTWKHSGGPRPSYPYQLPPSRTGKDDAERKVLEQIVQSYGHGGKGWVYLHTLVAPCMHCRDTIKAFRQQYGARISLSCTHSGHRSGDELRYGRTSVQNRTC
jgi:hypothetical protein